MKNESVIDYPKKSLDPSVWEKQVNPNNMLETYYLTAEAKDKVSKLIEYLALNLRKNTKFNCEIKTIHIIGSICSTQYTDSCDIDVHVLLDNISSAIEIDEKFINSVFKLIFDNYKKEYPELCFIKKHPLELYYQPNEFQDAMSAGCYDFIKKEWIVGPELVEPDYNPYTDLIKDIKVVMNSIKNNIRDTILGIYEDAFLCFKLAQGNDQNLTITHYNELKNKLYYAVELFDDLRNMRKAVSDPISLEQAIEFRNSRRWKIFNATFKLLNKYGYLGILREFKTLTEIISLDDTEYIKTICSKIIDVIKTKLGDNTNLIEFEKTEEINEGVGKFLSIALIAAMLSIPGILPAKTIEEQLKAVPTEYVKLHSDYVQNILNDASTLKEQYGKFSTIKAINIVSLTIYHEAQSETTEGRKAIASVIYNRAGGKVDKFAEVCLVPSQFSEWNPGNKVKLVRPKTDAEWRYTLPINIMQAKNKTIWSECVDLAAKMFTGNFKSTIGNRNMIANKSIDNPAAYDAWGQYADLKIGRHTFGYEACWDGFLTGKARAKAIAAEERAKKARNAEKAKTNTAAKSKTTAKAKTNTKSKTYIIKRGDNISSIAKKLKVKQQDLVKWNKIKNPNKISVGQKIKYF